MDEREEMQLLNPLRMQVLNPTCLADVLLDSADRTWLLEAGIDVDPLPDYRRSNMDPGELERRQSHRQLAESAGALLESILRARDELPEAYEPNDTEDDDGS
jgi:hypothetical protein